MTILIVTVAVAAEYTMNVHRLVQRTTGLQAAVAVGDATLEKLFVHWRAICRATPVTPLTTSAFGSVPLPTSAELNLPASSSFAKAGTTADLRDEFEPRLCRLERQDRSRGRNSPSAQ